MQHYHNNRIIQYYGMPREGVGGGGKISMAAVSVKRSIMIYFDIEDTTTRQAKHCAACKQASLLFFGWHDLLSCTG